MKAVVVSSVGGTFDIREASVRDPGPGEVKIKMAASGICHSDLSFQNGTLPSQLPMILGHEGAGVISQVGPGVTAVSVGDHVILNWSPSCGTCYFCRRGDTQLCSNRSAPAEPTHSMDGKPVGVCVGIGTMAEETTTRVANVVKIPDDVPLDIASLIGCGVMTGVGAAINTAKVEPGSSVVVFGCGGVGINVVMGARVCGAATIVAVDRLPEKAAQAKKFGATHSATPEELPALSQQLTEGRGFDYAFEVIGLGTTIRAAYDAARRGGTVVVVGAGKMTDTVSFNALELFSSEKKIFGSNYGSGNVQRDFPRLIALWRNGHLDLEGLISQRIPIEGAQDAFEKLARAEVLRSVIAF